MIHKSVKIWLEIGIGMILLQILLGGITRLTGSGLSITKWDIVTGVVFPVSDYSWQVEFNLYKETPQYSKINFGMSLNDFKFIFFWEYVHRMWARLMGLVFIIPLIYFLFKKRIGKELKFKLFIVILLALLVASLGWIMVASGFINRPWVSAYKLSFHLIVAITLLGYLLWTYLGYSYPKISNIRRINVASFYLFLVIIIFIQLFIGGIMSGMKAGLVAPTWPDINSNVIPIELITIFTLDHENLMNYEQNSVLPIVIQFIHRSIAYIICVLIIYNLIMNRRGQLNRNISIGFLFLILIQMILGILTLINCVGQIPLIFGVMHQLFGILLFCYSLIVLYFSKYRCVV